MRVEHCHDLEPDGIWSRGFAMAGTSIIENTFVRVKLELAFTPG